MDQIYKREGSDVLYNPYLDRCRASSRASSIASGVNRSVVEKDDLSDDSEGQAKPNTRKEVKKIKVQPKQPLMIKENTPIRGGFFSNMKNIMEMRKSMNQSISRGVTPSKNRIASTKSIDMSPNLNNSKLNPFLQSSITAGKVSLSQFIDSIATQKRINTSNITSRKLSAPNVDLRHETPIRMGLNVNKTCVTANKDKSFLAGFVLNLKIKKNDLSSMANDVSSTL